MFSNVWLSKLLNAGGSSTFVTDAPPSPVDFGVRTRHDAEPGRRNARTTNDVNICLKKRKDQKRKLKKGI